MPLPPDLPFRPITADAFTSLKDWNMPSIGHGLANGAPNDLNISESFPEKRLAELIGEFAQSELGSNMMTITCADPDTFEQAINYPERYDLVRTRMGGWSEFFIAMFDFHQDYIRRRPYYDSPAPAGNRTADEAAALADVPHASRYEMEALHHPYPHYEQLPPQRTMDAMWRLFLAIGEFWKIEADLDAMRSDFVVFMSNRIHLNPNYLAEYINAEAVIDELIRELGETEAYRKLFTDPKANISPPTTKLARARQLVSNEFVSLQLALGGFRTFGGAENYLGYISGANIKGHTPYRTFSQEPK